MGQVGAGTESTSCKLWHGQEGRKRADVIEILLALYHSHTTRETLHDDMFETAGPCSLHLANINDYIHEWGSLETSANRHEVMEHRGHPIHIVNAQTGKSAPGDDELDGVTSVLDDVSPGSLAGAGDFCTGTSTLDDCIQAQMRLRTSAWAPSGMDGVGRAVQCPCPAPPALFSFQVRAFRAHSHTDYPRLSHTAGVLRLFVSILVFPETSPFANNGS